MNTLTIDYQDLKDSMHEIISGACSCMLKNERTKEEDIWRTRIEGMRMLESNLDYIYKNKRMGVK